MNLEKFSLVQKALEDLREGKIILVTDDESRENEGDFICAAKYATPQNIAFMATYGRGLICMPVSKTVAKKFDFSPMTAVNTDNHETAFTVSVDHVNTTTGISAFDRSETAMALVCDASSSSDFRRPGHMFPLVAKDGGVLVRNGHTEATVDFCRLAGLGEAGLCCEIMKDDGTMARMEDHKAMAQRFGMTLVEIADLIEYRKATEQIYECLASAKLPTEYGMFTIKAYRNKYTGDEHQALVMGDVSSGENVLCRVHSECVTGDTFSSLKCDCGKQLDFAMEEIGKAGRGVLLYLRQEGRSIGITNKIKAYSLQEKGMDTVDANLALGLPEDGRDYTCAIQMLRDLGIKSVNLITNNPDKINWLTEGGITVNERIPVVIAPQEYSSFYLRTKAARMGHLL